MNLPPFPIVSSRPASVATTGDIMLTTGLFNDECTDKQALDEAPEEPEPPEPERPEPVRAEPERTEPERAESEMPEPERPEPEKPGSEYWRDDSSSIIEIPAPMRSLSSSSAGLSQAHDLTRSREHVAVQPSLPTKLPALPTAGSADAENVILEKQDVLMELERLRKAGVRLTKTYTLEDDIVDMQFEVRRQMMHLDELNAINFMKDAMRIAFTGVELANNKVGPFLDLDGWSVAIGNDINKYDHSLSKLYKKYWRRNTNAAPEVELALGIVGSMTMFHFRKKMHGFPLSSLASMVPPPPPRGGPRAAHLSDDSDDERPP